MIEFYLKSIFVFLILIVLLVLVLKFLEKRRFLYAQGVEGFKVIPLGGNEKIVIFAYGGKEFVIFSSSGSAVLLDKRTLVQKGNSKEVEE